MALAASAAACQDSERPPRLAGEAGADAGSMFDAGQPCPTTPTPFDCGNTTIPIELVRQNLYFVLDRSGSMGELLDDGSYDKYAAARLAINEMLGRIGQRVHYGAAVFPGSITDSVGCSAGSEVFSTRQGDPLGSSCDGGSGTTLLALQSSLGRFSTYAGTPIAPTLAALAADLRGLPGKTSLILATDGAPNCNPEARCGPSECMLNLEHASLDGRACDESFNCCDPSNLSVGPYSCVDRAASEREVMNLAAAGIPTYVIGMPGSELYASVLEVLAIAGGTARAGVPAYYAARDTAELSAILGEIGATVTVSCSIELADAPGDPDLVNVYFDSRLVLGDPVDGWVWTGARALELVGAACAELEAGDVRQVQVRFGCPTTIE
jgi:hypothetical protein